MAYGSAMPLNIWDEAAKYASYIMNRIPTQGNINRATSIEVLTGDNPRLTDIVVL